MAGFFVPREKIQQNVLTQTTTFFGVTSIKDGMAWGYRAYAKEKIPEHCAQYQAAEMDAQRQRTGLRHDSDPVAPWELRHRPTKREN